MKSNEQAALWQEEIHNAEEPGVASCNPDWKPHTGKARAFADKKTLYFDKVRSCLCFSVMPIAFNAAFKPKPIPGIVLQVAWLDAALRTGGFKIVPLTEAERLAMQQKQDEDAFSCLDEEYAPTTANAQRDTAINGFFGE